MYCVFGYFAILVFVFALGLLVSLGCLDLLIWVVCGFDFGFTLLHFGSCIAVFLRLRFLLLCTLLGFSVAS